MGKKLIRITTVPISLHKLLNGQLKFMSKYFEVIAVSSNNQFFDEIINDLEVRGIKINMTRRISPLTDLLSLIKLIHLFFNEKPVIVHTHTPKAGTLGMIASWLCRVPIRLHTVAGLPLLESKGIKRVVLNFVEKITYACSTKIYPNSFGLKEIIINEGFAKNNKLKVIGNGSSNGIDTSYFSLNSINTEKLAQMRNSMQIESNNFVFIFIGRLVKDKGINELVSAFTYLNKKYKNTKLLLVGDYESKLDPLSIETIEAIQNQENIIHTGYQADVRPFLSISNVLVFPSYREGFPNVPMQACAMNIPCIVSDINGCNEIIENNKNGLIIPPKNELAIKETMIKIMEDPLLYNYLKSNARASIVDRYDQLSLWRLLKVEYDEQIKNAGIN